MKIIFKDIIGRRINLIKLNLTYLDDFHEYSLNKKLYYHLGLLKPPTKKSESKNFLKKLIKRSKQKNANWWFIYLKKEKKVVGSIGAHNIDFNRKSFEISYALSPNYWGKGLFSDTLQLIIKRFFIQNSFERVFAITDSDNLKSIKTLKKNLFFEEGTLRNFTIDKKGKFKDAKILSFCKQYELKKYIKKINK